MAVRRLVPLIALASIVFFTNTKQILAMSTEGCDADLSVWEAKGVEFTVIRGVPLTGGFFYPLEYIRNNLLLSYQKISDMLVQRASVLLVGEGYSNLLPFLAQQNFKSLKAVDLAYGMNLPTNVRDSDELKVFMRRYKPYLIAGDARALPFTVGRPDYYFSHMLVNNLSEEDNLRVIDEAVRIVNTGGHIYIFGFDVQNGILGLKNSRLIRGQMPLMRSEGAGDIKAAVTARLTSTHAQKVKSFHFHRIEQTLRDQPASGYLLEIELR